MGSLLIWCYFSMEYQNTYCGLPIVTHRPIIAIKVTIWSLTPPNARLCASNQIQIFINFLLFYHGITNPIVVPPIGTHSCTIILKIKTFILPPPPTNLDFVHLDLWDCYILLVLFQYGISKHILWTPNCHSQAHHSL